MNASELMIMDWVLLDGTPIQVAGLHNRKVGVHKRRRSIYCSWHSDGEFRPIPLTSDILVKNGFEDVTEEGDRIRLLGTFDENDNITFVNLYPATIGYGTDIPQLKVYYVHQLQHLLRLAGVQKEIEL